MIWRRLRESKWLRDAVLAGLIENEDGPPRRTTSLLWPKQKWLLFYGDYLRYGEMTVRYSEMQSAVLYKLSPWPTGSILQVKTEKGIFNFCLVNERPFFRDPPFPMTRQNARLIDIRSVIAVRIFIFGLVGLWLLSVVARALWR